MPTSFIQLPFMIGGKRSQLSERPSTLAGSYAEPTRRAGVDYRLILNALLRGLIASLILLIVSGHSPSLPPLELLE
ncbi:hypothetical protein FLK61_37175 [Paenalkalicoccus suaedae]|uniref:Uncharacterized protein n=1 Tax=Paenalkalicoccus suaedae TaxID=2592382 RepID=A0A859FGV0_9BACI|nr:hypothetical protein FLK61_37175 [Paenalkalicoccus suaedae]